MSNTYLSDVDSQNPSGMVKLWARVGVTVNVPQEVYEQLQNEEINSKLMMSILKGQIAEAYIDGETYFPDVEENGELADVEFDLYDYDRKSVLNNNDRPLAEAEKKPLNDIIQSASSRTSAPEQSESKGKEPER